MKTAVEIAAAVRSRRASAEETVALALGRVDDANSRLNAFLDIFHERALEQARAVDTRVAAGEGNRLPLAGVPVALKDNICLAWGRTTAGSRMLERYASPYTATAARRLIEAGAVIVGKTNLDEFAMGSSGEHSAFGVTRNPHDPRRVPGGSSSGSAAAVAGGLVPLALGSDTGGSIRQPAGLCGCVGIKPTYGRVSRYGLIAYASSLDQIGPLTMTVADAAACLEVICGEDPEDMTSAARPAPALLTELETPLAGLRLGVPRQARSGANHAAVNRAMDRAEAAAKAAGAEVVTVELPHLDEAICAYYVVAPAEASSNLARFDGVRYGLREAGAEGTLESMYVATRTAGFGREVKRRIMLGAHVLSSGYHEAYYVTALKARRVIAAGYAACFDAGCHALLMPAAPTPAFRIGEKTSDPMAMYLEDVYTVGVNLAGLPGVTIPAGWTEPGEFDAPLPVGVQLVGRAFDEGTLLRAARMLERGLGFEAVSRAAASRA